MTSEKSRSFVRRAIYKAVAILCVCFGVCQCLDVAAYSDGSREIAIDSTVFSDISIRLNTELYSIAASVMNQEHLKTCYGAADTGLFQSYADNLNPLIPLALALNETGSWKNSNYTWTPAVYSDVLSLAGVDMSSLSVKSVDSDMFYAIGLAEYTYCGDNCSAGEESHSHQGGGRNDNDSLGPLQILRRYLESSGGTSYGCGAVSYDLMYWEDNVNYIFHNQGNAFSGSSHWNKDHEISNVYELAALMGTVHNTGSSFMNVSSGQGPAGSIWKDAGAVFDYCAYLSTEENISILQAHIDEWYEDVRGKAQNGEQFSMCGELPWSSAKVQELLNGLGVNQAIYTSDGQSFGHKQIYPLKAILNYMALERLYMSGYEQDV